MPPLIANAESGHHPDSLPLFRPQALAAQQKSYGEILLIRPFSLLFLGWLGIGIVATVFGFLTLGHYTEKAQITGFLISYREAESPTSGSRLKAIFYVPSGLGGVVQPGQDITLDCQSCPGATPRLAAKVVQVATAPQAGKREVVPDMDVRYEVTIGLATQTLTWFPKGNSAPTGMILSAEIPLGQKRLIRRLFERPAK